MTGVVDFFTANDIPGVNNWQVFGGDIPEEIFSSGKVYYVGQSVGMVVAETREIALEAAHRVKVVYGNEKPLVVDLEQAMDTPTNVTDASDEEYGDVDQALANADHVIEGRFRMGSQYHFHMETQTCIVSPVEDGFDVDIAGQDVKIPQRQVAAVLNIPDNSVNVTIKRLGGAFGAKVILPLHLACAAATAANKLNKPVRVWMTLEDNMKMLGKRHPYLMDYKVFLKMGIQ